MRVPSLLPILLLAAMVLPACCPKTQGDWLALEIERPEKVEPDVFENQGGETKDGLVTNIFRVHPGFLTMYPESDVSPSAADPFAPQPQPAERPPRPMPLRPQQVLEAFGVEFGPGASADYDNENFKFRVTQTPEQMDLVRAIFESLRDGGPPGDRSGIICRFEIFELAADEAFSLERSAGEHSVHSEERDVVLDLVREGKARVVTTVNLRGRSGQRFAYSDHVEVPTPEGVRNVGTLVECDPVLGPDDVTIDLNFSIEHLLVDWNGEALPESEPQFPVGLIEGQETLQRGDIKCLGSWTVPPRKDEESSRRLVFLQVTAANHLK